MTGIPPAASAGAVVRPIASGPTRLFATAIAGAAVTTSLATWADHHYTREPGADGESVDYIDRYEARNLFSGFDGFPAVGTFTALLPASFLYSHGRDGLSPKELSMLRTSYRLLGGALVGTLVAPLLLRPMGDRPGGEDAAAR